jgi:hypothetical protein
VDLCNRRVTLVFEAEGRHPVSHVKSPSFNELNGGDRAGLPPHTYAYGAYNSENLAASKRFAASVSAGYNGSASNKQLKFQGHYFAETSLVGALLV